MAVNWNSQALMARIRPAMMRGVVRWISAVDAESVRLIMSPPKTGKIYRRRSVKHQASAPGEAPANDTGRLVNSRRIDLFEERLTGRLTYSTKYARHLHYGTEKMEPRPWLEPALQSQKEAGIDMIREEMRAVLGEGGKK